jgi:hypothetical protein
MARVALPPWPDLILFMMSVLVISAFVLTAAGHFPREFRSPAVATRTGTLILWISVIVVAAFVGLTLAFTWWALPWYAAVIGGGLMVLIAPYLLHPLPDQFVNGRSALLVLAGVALLLGGCIYWTL